VYDPDRFPRPNPDNVFGWIASVIGCFNPRATRSVMIRNWAGSNVDASSSSFTANCCGVDVTR
jgi:hypothetical protein